MNQPDDSYAWKVTTVPSISRRDWFAGMALAGLMANCQESGKPDHYAKSCVIYADALIAALDKETK